MKSPKRPLNASRLPSTDLNWKAVLRNLGMGCSFLFCFATLEAHDGCDNVIEEGEQFITRDEGTHEPFVVFALFGCFGFGERTVVLDGVL